MFLIVYFSTFQFKCDSLLQENAVISVHRDLRSCQLGPTVQVKLFKKYIYIITYVAQSA